MVRLSALGAIALLGLASCETVAQSTVKVMPFGASIVSKCWRANLQTNLKSAGIKNFDFVGSNSGACAGVGIDQDHEGHPGSLATDYAKNGNLTGWLNANPADVILMLVGTNDVLNKKSNSDVLAAYDVLISQMRAKNPKIQIVFSNLLPLDPARFPSAAVSGIKSLNAAIATYAPTKSTAQSPVRYVDNFTGFDPAADTVDGEHPNDSGNAKMGQKFLDATKAAIQAASGAAAKGDVRKAGTLDNGLAVAVSNFLLKSSG